MTEGNAEWRLELSPAGLPGVSAVYRGVRLSPSPPEPFMAETTPVAEAATLPSIEEIERASAFAREPFLPEGEDMASALAPGTPRRRALEAAIVELEAGALVPSPHWRRQWSLLLGLDRLLSQDEPKLVDGTVLSAHQVDALSGTLTALLADRLKTGDHAPPAPVAESTRAAAAPAARPAGQAPASEPARTLPSTASSWPLLALASVVMLAMACGLTVRRRRME